MTDLLEGLRGDVRDAIDAKGLLTDPEVVRLLTSMTPGSRKQVLHQIGSLDVPWETAIGVAEFAEHDCEDSKEIAKPDPKRAIVSVRRDALKPNKFNAALFPDSLSGPSLEVLAESLKEGQREPIEVTTSYEIVNGERRWRASDVAGIDVVDVVIVGDLTDEEILDRVLDSCTSTRQPSPREKALVYSKVYERLQQTLGRKHGERFSDENVSTPKELKSIAIKRTGISSVMMAERLVAIFGRAPEEIQEKVNSGEMSVAAGYEATPRRGKAKPSASESDDEQDHESKAEPVPPRSNVQDNPFLDEDEETPGADPDLLQSESDATSAEPTQGEHHPELDDEDANDERDAGGDEDADDQEASDVDSDIASEAISVDEAIETLGQHLETMATSNLRGARLELRRIAELLRDRLKEAIHHAA